MDRKGKETEKRIIESALDLFVRNGYHGTSIHDITANIGLTKGALYAHFSSKSELLHKIINEFKTRFIDAMIRITDAYEGNSLEKLLRMIRFNSKFLFENYNLCVFLTLLTSELGDDADFEPALKSVYAKYQKFVSGIVRQGIQQGLFWKEHDPDFVALLIISMHDGLLHQWALNRKKLDGMKVVETFNKTLVYGLLGPDIDKPDEASLRPKT